MKKRLDVRPAIFGPYGPDAGTRPGDRVIGWATIIGWVLIVVGSLWLVVGCAPTASPNYQALEYWDCLGKPPYSYNYCDEQGRQRRKP